MSTSKVVEGILKRLKESGAPVLDLLQVYEVSEYEPYWKKDVRLYQAFVKKLISGGHPARALVLARKGMDQHPDALQLSYQVALALARGGNIASAEEYLRKLPPLPEQQRALKIEFLSLAGRLFKDRYRRTDKPSDRARFAKESLKRYEEAYMLSEGDYFPGINAATMALLAGDLTRARTLAQAICAREEPRLPRARKKADYWPVASVAEAHFILGDFQKAGVLYREAMLAMKDNVGDIVSMRGNYLLLADKLQVKDETWTTFNVGSVVVFAGHKIDDPAKPDLPMRFPADKALEGALSNAIRKEIEELLRIAQEKTSWNGRTA